MKRGESAQDGWFSDGIWQRLRKWLRAPTITIQSRLVYVAGWWEPSPDERRWTFIVIFLPVPVEIEGGEWMAVKGRRGWSLTFYGLGFENLGQWRYIVDLPYVKIERCDAW